MKLTAILYLKNAFQDLLACDHALDINLEHQLLSHLSLKVYYDAHAGLCLQVD